MKLTTKALSIALFLCLLTFSGCGIVGLKQIPHKNAEKWRTFDPNDYGINIKRNEKGAISSYGWSLDANFDEEGNILPYWKQNKAFINGNFVKGQLNGNTYPVIFDTGCNPMLVLSEKLVTKNDLAVFFFKPKDKNNSGALVIADSLKIGSFELTDYPCYLWRHKAEYRMFGLTVHSPEMIAIPLNIMRQFNYFKFDGIQKELSFSKQSSFEPEPASEWLSIPFRFEDLHLLLDVSIEEIETTLMLDTGAGYQFELNESLIEELFKKRPDFERAWKKTTHIYGPYGGGKTALKKFNAKNIHFADQTLNRVKFIYSDRREDNGHQGVIGSELFEKTVMVLDFEKNLMWVKKAKGSRFEEKQ